VLSYAAGPTDVPLLETDHRRRPRAHRRPARRPRGARSSAPPDGAGPTPSSTATSTGWRGRCSQPGLAAGDRVGIWAPNCAEWVLVQYATAKVGAGARHRQPGLPDVGAGVRPAAVRDRAARQRDGVQGQRLPRDGRRGAARLPGAAAGGLHRHERLGRPAGAGRRRRRGGPARAVGVAVARRPDQRAVHLRDRPASRRARRCRTATSSTTASSSPTSSASPSRTGCACRCPSTTASVW
jgi:hypothetical protein